MLVAVDEPRQASPSSLCSRVHAMVNVPNVVHWFRDATSDKRIDVLCRLLDCCMPLELRFLRTYLEELLRRNMVFSQPCEAACHQFSNVKDLGEITDPGSRRQLCVVLTRLRSENRTPAYSIYDILVRYDFTDFFSRIKTMEEELVDELLLLFTLAANHPAMAFSQRTLLHQRLTELREIIEKSFKCYQIDISSQGDGEYLCCSAESETTSTTATATATRNSSERSPSPESSSKTKVSTTEEKDPSKSNNNANAVYMKDLKVIKVQQRPFDKKYEYVFEVTWSNGRVIKIHRAYGELFDFQCKLRRRHSKDGVKVPGKRIIPYLPLIDEQRTSQRARRPIKLCKGNDILPDITKYVREFVQLPDHILRSEWVENFFSDGKEKIVEEPSSKQVSKSKKNSAEEKEETTTCKQFDATRLDTETKDKGNGFLKKHSPRGKCPMSISCKKPTSSVHNCGKLELRKRNPVSPIPSTLETTSNRDRVKVKSANHSPSPKGNPTNEISEGRPANHPHEVKISSHSPEDKAARHRQDDAQTSSHPPDTRISNDSEEIKPASQKHLLEVKTTNHPLEIQTVDHLEDKTSNHSPETKSVNHTLKVCLKSPTPFSSHIDDIQSTTSETKTVKEFCDSETVSDADKHTTNDENNSSSILSANEPQDTANATNCPEPILLSEKFVPDKKLDAHRNAIPPVTSQTTSQIVSRPPLTVAVPNHFPVCSTLSGDSSPTSSMSVSPIGSPETLLPIGPCLLPNLSLSPDQRLYDLGTFTPNTRNTNNLRTCRLPQYVGLLKDYTIEQVLNLCNHDIDQIEIDEPEKEKLKAGINHLKSSRVLSRNGFASSDAYPSVSQHGLLMVSNGYSHPQLEQSFLTKSGQATCENSDWKVKELDRNFNCVVENGEHANGLEGNENGRCKREISLTKKSNGFSRPYCYSCGGYGHAGPECLEVQAEDQSVS